MANPSRKRKSWEEKLNDAKDLPKVVRLKGKALRKWKVKTLAIPSPREVFSLIRKVPKGKIAPISALQSAVGRKHSADWVAPSPPGSSPGFPRMRPKSWRPSSPAPELHTGES
jgi:hypothetical protein